MTGNNPLAENRASCKNIQGSLKRKNAIVSPWQLACGIRYCDRRGKGTAIEPFRMRYFQQWPNVLGMFTRTARRLQIGFASVPVAIPESSDCLRLRESQEQVGAVACDPTVAERQFQNPRLIAFKPEVGARCLRDCSGRFPADCPGRKRGHVKLVPIAWFGSHFKPTRRAIISPQNLRHGYHALDFIYASRRTASSASSCRPAPPSAT